jgi:hypothetical protein
MRIPGRRGGAGGAVFASEAAAKCQRQESPSICEATIPMPFGSLGSTRVVALLAELDVLGCSLTIVEVDDDRLKVFARGARCVSFSFLVSFQLIVKSKRRM